MMTNSHDDANVTMWKMLPKNWGQRIRDEPMIKWKSVHGTWAKSDSQSAWPNQTKWIITPESQRLYHTILCGLPQTWCILKVNLNNPHPIRSSLSIACYGLIPEHGFSITWLHHINTMDLVWSRFYETSLCVISTWTRSILERELWQSLTSLTPPVLMCQYLWRHTEKWQTGSMSPN